MKLFNLLLGLILLLCCSTVSLAGGGPENVLVVVNANSWASKAVANEYVHLRQIPPSQVFYLDNVSTFETISVDDFRDKILKPVIQYIFKNKLSGQIDSIVYSSDLPYSVNLRSDIAKLPNKPNKIFTPTGSINGMTYLAALVLSGNPNYIGLNTNFYTRRLHRPGLPQPKLVKPPTKDEAASFTEATKLMRDKKWKEAAPKLEALAKAHPNIGTIQYNLACCQARLKQFDKTMQSLNAALDAGWLNSAHAQKDEDLQPVAKKKEFLAWIEKMKKREDIRKNEKQEIQPSTAFRSTYQWNQRGERVTEKGMRYFLSTMLAMTSGRGNSVDEAISSLRRSKSADETHPKGTIYILKNKNVRSTTRQRSFEPTVAKLKKMGINAEIIEGILPQKKKDVMGVVIGSAKYPWEGCGSTILPGAIVESLTSTSGVMRERAGQTPLSNMIRHGATASSGTVTEPYALQQKFPLPFMHVHYANGCSLAEAYYQSLSGPYQLLIVGDPLCQPWASKPKIAVQEIYPGSIIRKSMQLTPLYDGDPKDIDHFELFVHGFRVSRCKVNEKLNLDISKLNGGGYNVLTIVAVKSGAVETQGRVVIPVNIIRNNAPDVEITVEPGEQVSWNQTIVIHAECEGAAGIALTHNSRPLAIQEESKVKFEINPQQMGQGFVTLYALARSPNGFTRSVPITLEIVPPAALPAIAVKNKSLLKKGLALSWGNNQMGIKDTRNADWLSKQKLPEKTEFQLSGVFDAEEQAVYQFQLNGNCGSRLFVDDVELKSKNKTGWKYLPIHLAKGKHRFQLKGVTPKTKPRIRICFGGKGTYSLSEKEFSSVLK